MSDAADVSDTVAAGSRALVTRPQEDAADIAAALVGRGITPVIAPMMAVTPRDADIDADVAAAQALLFTSRNGVRAFCRLSGRRDIPVYAVGDSTAALARDEGFETADSAAGDSVALARLVAGRLTPAGGPLFHAAGETVAGDMAAALAADGFDVVRRTLYEARPVDDLPAAARDALTRGDLDYVLFFSPRTARIFEELLSRENISTATRPLTAICLSDAVAAALRRDAWKGCHVAAQPTAEALLAALDGAEAGRKSGVPENRPGTRRLEPPPESEDKGTSPWGGAPLKTDDGGKMADDKSRDTGQANATPENTPAAKSATGQADAKPADKQEIKPKSAPKSAPGNKPEGKPRRSAQVAVAWTLVVVLLAAGAGYVTLPQWRDSLPQPIRDRLAGAGAPAAQEIAAVRDLAAAAKSEVAELRRLNAELSATVGGLGDRLTALEARLRDAEAGLAAARESAGASPDPALAQKILDLEQSLSAALQARATADSRAAESETQRAQNVAALTDLVARTNTRLDEVEAKLQDARRAAASSDRSDSLALAAGQMRDALARTGPFEAELQTLRRLGAAHPEIAAAVAPVEPFAATGVPSQAALMNRLPAVIDGAVAASRTAGDSGWIDRTVSKLRGFVTVRRVDGKGDDVDAVLARAEAAARRDDLETAVAELSALTGDAAAAAADWLAAARSRLAADAARAALNRVVLGTLATGG